MKVVHINAGNEIGGGLFHIVSLLKELKEHKIDLILLEEGPVSEAARAAGVSVHVFQQRSRYDLSVLVRLKQFIDTQNYTLIHTHGPRANTLMSIMRPFVKAKWITTVHSDPSLDFKDKGLKGKVFEWLNKKAIKQTDGVIAVSHEISRVVQRLGVAKASVQVIFNGIPFNDRLLTKKDKQRLTIVTVGRLHPIKGYDLLVEALGELELMDWHWIVCGKGEQENKIRTLSRDFGIESHLTFLGWVSQERIKEGLAQVDILIQPSLSEGFPYVLLEAAEQHLPVIATNVGDVKELLINDTMGWLIEPNNKPELKSAIQDVYKEWKSNQLEEKGDRFNKWAKHFSLTNQAKHVLDFYNKIEK